MSPIIVPTPINNVPEIIFVKCIEFGDDRKDRTLEINLIINKWPAIGTEKETVEITIISMKLISLKSKKLGNKVR